MYKRYGILVVLSAVALASVLLFSGCGGGSTPAPTPSAAGTLSGTVTDTTGAAVAAVTVAAGGRSVATGADGKYTLANVGVGNSVVVTFSKLGLVTTTAVATVTNGQTSQASTTMIAVGNLSVISPATPQTVADDRADNNNGSVRFQANSILDASNNPVASAAVAITTGFPSDPSFTNVFPGLFLGTDAQGGNIGPIESFGFIDVTLASLTGAVHLDPTKPATITFPIDPAHDPGDATVPLWSLNPATGIWKQEANSATRDTSVNPHVYRAQVTHFSPYNLDKRFAGGPLVVTVLLNSNDSPVPGAAVTVKSFTTSGMWEGRGVTGSTGTVTLTVPQGFIVVDATKGALAGGLEGHALPTITIKIR